MRTYMVFCTKSDSLVKMAHTTILLAVALMAIAVVSLGSVFAATPADEPDVHVIMTSAMGEVTAAPDQGEISLAVQTQNKDPKVAQQENAALMGKVQDALIASGIPKEDLRTTGFSIYPIYEDQGTMFGRSVKLYQVTNTLLVTIHDVTKAGDVIDVAVANGANQVNSLTFSLSDEREQVYRNQAIQEAIAKTRADADTAAQAIGVSITGVKEVSIGSYSPPIFYAGAAVSKMEADGSAMMSTPIQTGELKVTAQVSVTYLIP